MYRAGSLNSMTSKTSTDIPDLVSRSLQLAVLLEVSAYPKPGNVHRTSNFHQTSYEHYLASAVALMPHFAHAAYRGAKASQNKVALSRVGIGKIIKETVTDINVWQHGGNTLLGSVILLVPMATAAGFMLTESSRFSVDGLRRDLKHVVENTSTDDALNLYDAIALAQPGGLGKSPQLDVTDAKSKQEILEKHISLFDVFKISAPWDSVSNEWVTNYPITFDIGYPFFFQQLNGTRDINAVTVNTYLKILSLVPDSLIRRKAGTDKSKWVSDQAGRILEAGALNTSEGRRRLRELDHRLHDADHKLNPGTTADLTSAVLAVAILGGYRP